MYVVPRFIFLLTFESPHFQSQGTRACDDDDDDGDEDEVLGLIDETNDILEGFRILMDALMKTYQEPCVAVAQALVLPILGDFLSKPLFGPDIKATAMNIMNSIIKNGGAQGSELVPVVLPLWLAASQEQDADVRATAIYGIGIFAMSNPGFVNQALTFIWSNLQTLLGKKIEMASEEEEQIVWENALAATFRLFRSGLLSDHSIYNGLLSLLPIEEDSDEAAAVIEMVTSMSDRFRPPTGVRSLAERQVQLLRERHDNFQQVHLPFSRFRHP
jgi:hypothetical protein